jgi:hypothetical protein
MKITDEELRAVWQEGGDPPASECLTDAAWARLLSKAATAPERLRAAEHMASCAVCADDYRALRLLQPWEGELERALPSQAADPASRWTSWRAWWSPPRLAIIAAAAAVLLAVQAVLLSQLVAGRRQNARLETELADNRARLSDTETSLSAMQRQLRGETAAREQLENLSRQPQAQHPTPQLGATIVELEPRPAEAVRGIAVPQIVTTGSSAGAVTLILHLPPLASRTTLEIEVADAAGQIRWTGRTEREQGADTMTLALPTADYPAGNYVIRLLDVTRGRSTLAMYPIAMRYTSERR